ncbi:MAG: glycosyltransferase [Caulobacteraceae bacterium]
MRILNVGDFNWMTGRERDTANVDLFAIRQKLSRAAIRAGHMVAEYSDRAVSRTSAPLRLRGLGVRASNRGFLNMVDEVRPDLILLNFADDISNESLAEARRLVPGVVIADINIDPLPDPKTRARLERRRGMVDAVFLTTAGEGLRGLAGPGAFAAFMPNPVDATVEDGCAFKTPSPTVDLILPVGDDSPRQIGDDRLRTSETSARLATALPGVHLAVPGLGQPRLRGQAYFQALLDARIGWALSRHNDQPLYASDRMAHMLGVGLPVLLDRRPGFERFYGEDEIGFYRDLDELILRTRTLLADDDLRRETARRGWTKTWALFKGGRVFDYVYQQLFREGGANTFEWPVERWES